MSDLQSSSDEEVWARLIALYRSELYNSADTPESTRANLRKHILQDATDRVALIKSHLVNDRAWNLALDLVIKELEPDEYILLLPELVYRFFNSRIGGEVKVAELLFRIPRPIFLSAIEELSEPYLTDGDEVEWIALLGQLDRVDPAMTERIAIRATENDSEHIKEVGHFFLDRLALEGSGK